MNLIEYDELTKIKRRNSDLETQIKQLKDQLGILRKSNKSLRTEVLKLKNENQILREQNGGLPGNLKQYVEE